MTITQEGMTRIALDWFIEACRNAPKVGSFSGLHNDIGVGKWGNYTIAFDRNNNVVYKILRGRTGSFVVIYKLPDPLLGFPGRFEPGEDSINEVLFGSSWEWAAFGGPEAALEYRLSESEVATFLDQIERTGINLDEYLD